ncbi:unnamed protein product [Prunus armeniaca]|uniref:Uncharacterized protein n=1 Tax=Prunus armeniaca TaxID=36596 RepID=A0A6J5VD23_PRUAR|nr:unnamed protein product [Prunus armeniaca]
MTPTINATHPEHPTCVRTVLHTRGKPALLWGVRGLTRLTEHSATADRPEKCSPLHSTIAHLDSSKMFPKSDSSVKKQTTPHPRELSRRVGGLVDARYLRSQAARLEQC